MDQPMRVQMLQRARERQGDRHALGDGQCAARPQVVLEGARRVALKGRIKNAEGRFMP
jgi:hypothetical protein